MIINCRNLLGHTTGVQRYTQRIIDELKKNNNKIIEIRPKQGMSGIKGHLWEQLILPLEIMKEKEKSSLWSPSNTGPLLIKDQVITIHDTVPFDHPEWLNKRFVEWYKYIQPKLVKKVRHIITISEFSKERIIENLGVPEHKISVVYNGVDLNKNITFEKSAHNNFGSLSNYILSVGSLEPRKNIANLIKAFIQFKKETKSDIKLVIVGKEGVGRVFNTSASHTKDVNKDIIYTGHVSDFELDFLHKNAKGFCYPSLYEGFGLPPLEAMLYGTPVLTSNNTAMKELCTGRAILIDPFSVTEIAEGIERLITKPVTEQQISSNIEFAHSLSWAKCAKETSNILNYCR
ncbi:glycosyltransferase family 4 protein [Klebsiella pneumoniae]|uniref:glycosyltransferase family 4 protein n=1 Tax=Klebsiella pneumoniae TaxID=573 RepID=UPI0010836178|nr:glycosyltransferase family 1 protein [Klebsiella pneumoniae]VGF88526.1 Partial mannosyltransferase B [Klebsiella pneumoniae]